MKKFLVLLAMASFVTTPAFASARDAAFASSLDRPDGQRSMFAGATYRVGFGQGARQSRGRAALTLTGMTRAPTAEVRLGQGLELAGGSSGRPTLYLAGQEMREVSKQANMSTGGKIAIGVGVIALIGAVVVGAIWYDATKCDRQDCE